jgi:muskelin
MFGGNPADVNTPSMRLDDFWKLTLVRPTVADVLRQTRFLVRQQRFYEMARSAKSSGIGGLASPAAMQALTYLQTEVSAVVNHSDEGESAVFRKLMSHLLSGGSNSGNASGNVSGSGSMEDIRETAEVSQEATPRAQNKRRRAKSGHTSATSSDGLEDLEDSDMLSISQIIDQRASTAVLLEEGKPTELYRQRAHLFNKLLGFFPSDCVEPAGELPDAVALLSARMINRGT